MISLDNLKFLEISPIDLLKNFDAYIIPFLRKKLQANQINGKIIILTKAVNPPDVLLVVEIKSNKRAEIHSVFVDKKYRLKGVGSKLIQITENFLKKNDFKTIDLIFFDTWQNKDFLIKYFRQNNWATHQKTVQNFRVNNKNGLSLDWVQNSLKQESEIEYKTWGEITEKQRQKLQEKIHNTPNFTHYLTPFQELAILELDCSQVAIKNDEIIGWSIIHKRSSNLLQCSALYVFEEHRANIITKKLLARNLFYNVQNKYETTIFQVQYKNEMVRKYLSTMFSEKDVISKSYHTLASVKNL